MTLQETLLALESDFWTGGPQVWHDHCADTCLVAFAEMSGPMSREDIARTAEDGRWRDLTMMLKGLITPSEDVAILTYEASAVRRDEQAHHAVVSSAYHRHADGWKLVFHQQTPREPEGYAPPED